MLNPGVFRVKGEGDWDWRGFPLSAAGERGRLVFPAPVSEKSSDLSGEGFGSCGEVADLFIPRSRPRVMLRGGGIEGRGVLFSVK